MSATKPRPCSTSIGLAVLVAATLHASLAQALQAAPDDPLFPGPLGKASYGAAIVAIGDMDNDGKPDVVTTDLSGSLSVTRAVGKGFAAPQLTAMPVASYFHAIGDLDLDGIPDVVVAGADDRAWVFLGNGNGTFKAPTSYAAGKAIWSIAIGDLDSDGDPDVVTGSHLATGAVSVLLGTGNGALLPKVDYPCAGLPYEVTVADADGDGKSDVVVACNTSPSGTIAFLRGKGTGALYAPVTYASGNSTHAVTVADFNGDGHPDIGGSNVSSNDITILLGTGLVGPAAFAPGPVASAGPYPAFLTALDANADGKLDLAVCNEFGNSATVILGNGNGSFGAGVAYVTAGAPATIAAADFDQDGHIDLVTAHANGDDKFTALYGKPGGQFGGAHALPTSLAFPFAVASGDLNEDGRPDLVSADYCGVACGGISFFLGNASNGFDPAAAHGTGFGPEWVALADVDLDRHLDVVTADWQSGSVSVLRGDGHGGVLSASSVFIGASPTHVALADLDGDDAPDLVVCAYTAAAVKVYRNVLGNFQLQQTMNTGNGSGPTRSAIGDLNHDGRPDLVVALAGSNNALVYLGMPGGSFGAATNIAIGATQRVLALADFDGNGDLDLATNGQSSGLRVKLGNGIGGFGPPIDVASDQAPHDLAAGDIDGDGKVDLVSVGSVLAVEFGDGAGGFSPPNFFAATASPYGLAVVDLDGDGREDVVTANYNSANIEILAGQRALPQGVASYGAGTSGCAGTLGMAASPSPQAGQSAFTFTTTNAPRQAQGFLLIGTSPLVPSSDLFGVGITIEVSPYGGTFFILDMKSDAQGAGSLHVPIPASIPAGFKAYAQSVWFEAPGFACSASSHSLVSSRGVEITIQP